VSAAFVLDVGKPRWVGDRGGEPLADVVREQVVARLRMVYDRWGIAYELRG
jgi:hypothetical protein